jgi:CRISPR-associated protein Cas2
LTATTLLIYDIPSDRLRTKVANACLDYGLERIQYSAFQGPLSHNRQEELMQRIRRIMGPHAATVQLVPVCEKDLRCTVRWLQSEPPSTTQAAPGAGHRPTANLEGRRYNGIALSQLKPVCRQSGWLRKQRPRRQNRSEPPAFKIAFLGSVGPSASGLACSSSRGRVGVHYHRLVIEY